LNILFDLDGTLTDSGEGITRCIEHALVRLGRTAPPLEALRRFVGPPLHETFAELLESPDRALVDEAITLYRERFVPTGMFENSLYPAVASALEALQRDGHRLWVVTSKPTVYAERIVQHFGLDRWLERVYGSELSGENGDKRRLIREVLSREALVPRETWMVGDRMHDVRGARENGLRSVGVLWGYGREDELRAARPDGIVASMPELCAFLAQSVGRP
jgi:phosphoglycolate phosphatase